jgi:hypothetical protein
VCGGISFEITFLYRKICRKKNEVITKYVQVGVVADRLKIYPKRARRIRYMVDPMKRIALRPATDQKIMDK